ncbi:hypothetical protein ACFYQA_22465 [Streptomyces sp. NPDC005774]|uniref:hypothetical protein n=1 Tax=Streptomyces sp. NPDC005774 TaxID=3364728 RepID=UPI0036AA77B8
MADDIETTQPAPKKTPRKPDPVTQLLNDVRVEMKALGDLSIELHPDIKAQHYDTRAAAWNRYYYKSETLDGLVLSLAFEALAGLNDAERRYSLTQLAAACLVAAERLDGGK